MDLIGANLRGVNLSKANLRRASLWGANLSGVLLSEADLMEAYLSEATLSGAALSRTHLIRAFLTKANLRDANLRGAILQGAYLSEANLSGADLRGAILIEADLSGADLSGAVLNGAVLGFSVLSRAVLSGAFLAGADLRGSILRNANLSGADLRGVGLQETQLIETNLCDATLTGSRVYGVSVWDIQVNEGTKQQDLIITDRDRDEPVVTVDNLKVAQFIYLLLNNQEIRDVIDTITSKAVLILGNFSDERKAVLDAIREELRKHDYLPIQFDFPPLTNQTPIETIKILASMARFVIADLTDPRSVLQELQIIDTHCRTVAVRLIKKRGDPEHGMLNFKNSPWFVEGRYEYDNAGEVIASIKENIIGPAEAKVRELRQCH